MIKLIDRYVFKEIAVPAMLGLLVWTSIFIVNNFFKLADQWVKGTLALPDVGRVIVYLVPSILAMTLPMSVLLGVLIGFSRLSADSEITALRTTGISYFRLLRPTMALAVLAWAATTGVYMHAVPWANTRVVELQAAAARRVDLNREVRPGTWTPLSDGSSSQDSAIFAKGIDATDPDKPWLTDVDILTIDRQQGEARHFQARRARLEHVVTGDGTGRIKYSFEGLRTILWRTDTSGELPKVSEATRGDPLMSEHRTGARAAASMRLMDKSVRLQNLGELRQTLHDLDEMDRIDELKKTDPQAAARLQAGSRVSLVPQVRERQRRLATMEIHKKFAIPAACLVFAIAGMPLGISTRRGGRPASFAISIAVIILWWLIYDYAQTWCLAGRLSPAAGAWMPDLVIGVVAVHALIAQRRQQAVGLYRALRDNLLLGSLVLLLLTGVFLWERREAALGGTAVPSLPAWAPVGAAVLLALHLLALRYRDPLSRLLADLSEAFRRPRADGLAASVGTSSEETGEIEAGIVAQAPSTLPPEDAGGAHEDRKWLRRGRLERIRGALVFGLLAITVFSAVEAFQHDDGPVAGARALVVSWEPIAIVLLGLGCIALQLAGVRMISTLDWWVVSALTRVFALVMGSMLVLYVIITYLDLADTIMQNDVRAATVLDYFLHLAPRMITEVLPFSAMLAVLVAFGIMSKFNETTALRCGGISIWRAVMPAMLLGILACFGAFVLHDYVVPRASQTAEDLKRQMQGAPPLRRAEVRSFLMGADGRSLYQLRSISATETAGAVDAQIRGLTLLRQGPDGRIHDLWTANDAVWKGEAWVLRNGWHAVIDESNQVTVQTFEETPLTSMERPEYFAAMRRNPAQMAFAEFSRYVTEQTAAGFPTAPLEVTLHRKLAAPAATLVLILIGLPFAFTTGRRGALYGVGIALMLSVVYLASVALFEALGGAAYLPPAAAAWAPNAIFTLAGVYMLLHVRT